MSITHIAFYPSDYNSGVSKLSDAERGVYWSLISHMYEEAGPIERDDERLARLCGCKTKARFVKALDYLIEQGKITIADGWLFNDRAQKEIQKTVEKSSKAKQSADRRWRKKRNKNNGGTYANASQTHMPLQCYPEPEPITPKVPFSDFWILWPVKTNKDAAQKAWQKLSPNNQNAAINSLPGWFDRWRARYPDANAIHASTFLNKKRWEDEAPASSQHDPNSFVARLEREKEKERRAAQ